VKISEGKKLSELTTFRIGGLARYFVRVEDVSDFKQAFLWAKERGVKLLVLGKGSNCLFDDRGFDGLVILNSIDFCEKAGGEFRVGGGFSFSRLGVISAKEGFGGLEFAASIPGTVGGAVFMNAGACGQETAQVIKEVKHLDLDGDLKTFGKGEMEFGYRTSVFQKMQGAVVSATFSLEESLEAREKQCEKVAYRRATQPLTEPSSGCIFRNPQDKPAGLLIEEAGLKGLTVGGAMISDKHANFIVNKGGASSSDVLTLIDRVKVEVEKHCGIELESEVRVIPYE